MSLMLFPLQREDSSYSSPAPVWGYSYKREFFTNISSMSPSYRQQFFTNCSRVGPFHRMQTSRNCSSMGPPQGCKSCHQTCISVGFSLHGSAGSVRSLLQHGLLTHSVLQVSTFSAWSPPQAADGSLLHCGPACLTIVFTMDAGESVLQSLNHLSSSTNLRVYRVSLACSYSLLQLLLCSRFCCS